VSFFDPATGLYCRTGTLDEAGRDTGLDPFMAEFPELLDVGVMGHCAHGLSGACAVTGVGCYQSGATRAEPHMTLAGFKRIVDEAKGRTFQFALGGRGDPELHGDFEAMLAYSREAGIVPNLTTSGYRLTSQHAALIRRYCGAAAVSWYRAPHTERAIDLLLGAGVRTNVHFLLGRDTIDEAIRLLGAGGFTSGINRVIFLLHKPVGQGTAADVLRPEDPRVAELFGLIQVEPGLSLAGFDSCCVPGVINWAPGVDPDSFDACEAARYSAYVTPDQKLLPCSFDQELRWAVDISRASIAVAWESPEFEEFRGRLAGACPGCPRRRLCLGGCPIKPEIVLCAERGRLS
jgi:radical SAM protein with 4Fe4S-binding SPASM domain